MHRFQCGGQKLPAYRFDLFAGLPVQAVVSTRRGGVSPPPWDSLNFSILRGDTPRNVKSNLARFTAACGFERNQIIIARQVRGSEIRCVGRHHSGTRVEGVDGLCTATTELPLLTLYADCVPVVAYDPARHALGVCHAGWQGTTERVAGKLARAMKREFNTHPSDLVCGLGPSIGPQSYEIGPDVIRHVRSTLFQADELLRPSARDGHAYFDLWRANKLQLMDAGVLPERIEVSGLDTACLTDTFFSHRAEKGRCGLFGMMCWLEQ